MVLALATLTKTFLAVLTTSSLTAGAKRFPEGEAYKKTPELVQTFQEVLPCTDIPYQYIVFKPLAAVDPDKEEPKIVVFYANPDQLSALVVLANYGRPYNDNVTILFGAGCHSVCLIPLKEAEQPHCGQ